MSTISRRLSSVTSHLAGTSSTQDTAKTDKDANTMSRPKVVVARHLGKEVMALLERPDIELVAWSSETQKCPRRWLLENVKGAAGLVVVLTDKVDQEVVDAAGSSLKIVSTMSVGYEHVDDKLLSVRGIRLGYTPDVLTEAVADISVMLALMASRNVKETTTIVQRGEWPKNPWAPFAFCGPQLSATAVHPTRTVGFLGFGRIAQATLARLIPFGITHCLYTGNPTSSADPGLDASIAAKFGLQGARRVGLDELARESDVVFVLAPGVQATRHIVDEAFLKKMRSTAVLVNTSRGTLVDSEALARACCEGWIWGAGVDVVEGEPQVLADHPLVKEPRCVVLPHIGSATTETRLGMATLAANNLLGGLFDGEMPAEVKFR